MDINGQQTNRPTKYIFSFIGKIITSGVASGISLVVGLPVLVARIMEEWQFNTDPKLITFLSVGIIVLLAMYAYEYWYNKKHDQFKFLKDKIYEYYALIIAEKSCTRKELVEDIEYREEKIKQLRKDKELLHNLNYIQTNKEAQKALAVILDAVSCVINESNLVNTYDNRVLMKKMREDRILSTNDLAEKIAAQATYEPTLSFQDYTDKVELYENYFITNRNKLFKTLGIK